ncbi:MAG: ATP-binding protein, partial [Bacillota bacterium]
MLAEVRSTPTVVQTCQAKEVVVVVSMSQAGTGVLGASLCQLKLGRRFVMALLYHLRVRNFRGIQSLDWHTKGRVLCLVGPGDTGKTTILDAIELALLPRWNASFTDSDFYQSNTEEGLIIEATVGELPEVLVKDDKYGLYLRGYSVRESAIHDDPADDDEHVLTIRLSVASDLEPHWAVVKDSNPEPRSISWRDRELLGVSALGDNVDRNLTWGRGSALARLTDLKSSEQVIAVANRRAREAVSEMELEEWQQIADQAKVMARRFGVALDDLRPGLDAQRVRFGQGVLSLYDGPIPLQSFGLGSRRLTALALQAAGVGESAIVLVDEVEHGLEPHRIRKLLAALCVDRNAGQVIMTSHSPTPVVALSVEQLRFTRYEEGRLDLLSCDEEAQDALQPVLRKCPLAVFARSVILCEGKTEEALCNVLNGVWSSSHGGEDFELRGVVAANGEGQTAPEVARQFARLGYRVVFFGDSDKAITPNPHELRAAGADVLLWDGNMTTEQRIATDVPLP